MGSQVWSLISLGVGLNLVLGALVAAFKFPIYLDSVGSVLVGATAGPVAGALTGCCGVALLGLTSPTSLAFLPVGAAVGCMAGLSASWGGFRSLWAAGVTGACCGTFAAALSAPISATLFGGVTGGGTDLLVAAFRAGGLGTLQAAFGQGLAVDPADKAATFLLVYGLLQALPRRAIMPFPLAEKAPQIQERAPTYRPQSWAAEQLESPAVPALATSDSGRYPQASTEWKTAALLSLLAMAGLTGQPARLTLELLVILTIYTVAAPKLTLRVCRRLGPVLLPLALSLSLIHGLVARSASEPRLIWWGLSWSLSGLELAWITFARVAIMLLALSMFLALTPLQRLAELLTRWRVPYPLVFVLLTGSNLGFRLRERWRVVEEAQQARGLRLRPAGWRARVRVLIGLLTPTLGSVFAELPSRSAILESRGLLRARPRWAVPSAWRNEPPATLGGKLFHAGLIVAAWVGVSWAWF